MTSERERRQCPADRDDALADATGAPHPRARIAERLREALETADPSLFMPLLHPQVRWGGEGDTPQTCRSRTDVLAWYGRLRDAGVRAHVEEVELRDHAVVLGMSLTGRDRGADRVFQVFRLAGEQADALVVDIRGFPERGQALAVADGPLT